MLKIRIEFYEEEERSKFMEYLQKRFNIITESKIKPSKVEGCNLSIQYIEVVAKNGIH